MEHRPYSRIYRIMHWSIAICMLLILLTIFLRLGWMEKNHVAGIIGSYLAENGQSLSDEQLIVLAKKIRKPMWDWHIYLGYVLVGLYSIRLALPFFGEMKFAKPFEAGNGSRLKIQYSVYLLFYLCVGISLITGLLIVHGPKDWKTGLEAIHKPSIYYLLGFIIFHFAGVLNAELGSHKGIISRIISGKKTS